MTLHTSPILHSLLDTDAYKLHMQQAVYHHYYDVDVAAEFRCRGDELLGVYADEIAHQVDLMRFLSLSDDEFTYLSSLPFFKPDYLHWLRDFRFNPRQVSIKNHAGKLDIRITGPWREVILWEVPLLAVISEVVHRDRSPHITTEQALAQLSASLESFRQNCEDVDLSRFKLMDFGTRRRFSRDVQQTIVTTLRADFLISSAPAITIWHAVWISRLSVRRHTSGFRRISRLVRRWQTASAPRYKCGYGNIPHI